VVRTRCGSKINAPAPYAQQHHKLNEIGALCGRYKFNMSSQAFVSILGVQISNYSQRDAIELIEELIKERKDTHAIFIANAHTLNVASEEPRYRAVLNSATKVFADGTGARWAARLRGVRLKENLVGTDLVPQLFQATADRGYRYFLLGADAHAIERAAQACIRDYPGWKLAGFHHGYIEGDRASEVIEQINAARPDLLLVAMGNPRQEIWIHTHQTQLRVPVCIGVGGLFDHWAGNLQRAPLWVRRRGLEWLQILLQQPHKWRRYLLGNPLFLFRVVASLRRDRLLSAGARNDRPPCGASSKRQSPAGR
jgi:N-acetylglucosaminyldiphosphoundecaprenol N-acetyl-beta-D-mannosaminyltransferase